jgi:signal transduction histidine kinase
MPDNNLTKTSRSPASTYSYLWIAVSLMATIVVAGFIIADTAQNFFNDNARKSFLARTKVAATVIDPANITALSSNKSDITIDAYHRLKKQLISIKNASEDMRFVYLMGKRNNQVLFLVDAEPPNSKDYSPPGEIYPNPSDELLEIFQNGQAFVEGPIIDDWGTWISGHAPIMDSDEYDEEEVVAVIGIDIDAHIWKQTVSLYRWGSISIMLLLLSLVFLYLFSLSRVSRANAERRHTANQLENVVAELRDTNKELESFSYSVSHDLRAPLRHIHGYSEALEEDYRDKLTGEGLKYLQRLRHAADNMDRLILGLLRLSKVSKQGLNINKVYLSSLAQDVIQELNKEYKNKIYKTIVTPDLICFGDTRLLRIVLENLISNAYKYSALKEQPEIEFGCTETDGVTAYYVKDNGIGFDMAHQEKIFEPFQRLHGAGEFEGSGIGLSTVARIIRRHKGRIWAEGKPNEGAVFYFTLGLIV